jgi:5'-3' exoribonuclease 1
MHLSLLREYLDLEFSSLSAELPFPYNLENVIDDFILISVFVGNDFLPHLPNLHINEGAMETIWGIYKRVLPNAGGYMNENGKINVARLQLVLNELGDFEREIFERDFSTGTGQSGGGDMAKNRGKLSAFFSFPPLYLLSPVSMLLL